MSLEKQLADTDSIYCTKVTNSNQSSIFIGKIDEHEIKVLFGEDFKTNDSVRLRLSKRNLAFAAIAHVIDRRVWYKRKSSDKWEIGPTWLTERLKTLDKVFTAGETTFIGQLNKDDQSTHRLYLKGITALPREDGAASIPLRDFLFSGDRIVLTKLDSGDVSFEISIPDNPVVHSITPNSPTRTTFSRPDILAAIRTKPFLLLAGISGTGKSRMVRQLARGCCPEKDADGNAHPLCDGGKPGNFEMVQVRPNWHDSSELMGYVSRLSGSPEYQLTDFVRFLAKAWLFPDVPFFLCLDEMNLAPVEQYFAEFLSVVETRRRAADGSIETDALVRFPPEIADKTIDALLREYWDEAWKDKVDAERVKVVKARFKADKGLRIPPNFVVVGTVNMDETTFSFSRKVLDRAMSFELGIEAGGLALDKADGADLAAGSIDPAAALASRLKPAEFYAANKAVCDEAVSFLEEVNAALAKTPFQIAYRTRDEVLLYCVERTAAVAGAPLWQALDEAAAMKVLSRVEGDDGRREALDALAEAIKKSLVALGMPEEEWPGRVCARKIEEMRAALDAGGYMSFWTR